MGTKGDSYDNALAEAFNSLYKAELIRNKGPWTGINDLEIATAEYTSIGSTTEGSTARLATGHPSKSKPSSYNAPPRPSHQWNGSNRPSTKPGA